MNSKAELNFVCETMEFITAKLEIKMFGARFQSFAFIQINNSLTKMSSHFVSLKENFGLL